jgi:hypothetical protein
MPEVQKPVLEHAAPAPKETLACLVADPADFKKQMDELALLAKPCVFRPILKKFLALGLDFALGESRTTVAAGGTVVVIQRLRLGDCFEKMRAALRAG